MSLAALDDLDDAVAATKRLLLPFDVGTWLRLALIAVFVGSVGGLGGGGGGGGGGGTDAGGSPIDVPTSFPPELPTLTEGVLAILAGVVALLVLLGLAFLLVGSVLEFALVESLRTQEVHVRRYARRHWGAGLRLFGFRLVLGLLTLAVIGVVLALLVGPILAGNAAPARLFATLLLAVPVLFLVGFVAAVIGSFTTVFVVPVMLLEDRGVLSAWGRFWSTLVAEWREFAVYAVVAFVLNVVAGFVIGALLAPVAVILFVPVGVGGVLGLVSGAFSPLLVAVFVVLALVGALVLLGVGAAIEVPALAYLRYYALFVLGDADPDLDLLPELRRAVRDEDDDA